MARGYYKPTLMVSYSLGQGHIYSTTAESNPMNLVLFLITAKQCCGRPLGGVILFLGGVPCSSDVANVAEEPQVLK